MDKNEGLSESILAQSAERYRLAGRHIAGILNKHLAETLSAQTMLAIEDTMVLACYTDNALDAQDVAESNSYEDIIEASVNYLMGPYEDDMVPPLYSACTEEAQTVRDYLVGHDTDGRTALRHDFLLYHKLSRELQDAREPRLYASLTRIEGRVAMRCLLDLLPLDIRTNPSNLRTFEWLKRLGQLGNTYDSIADSRTDVRNGRTRAGSPLSLRISLAKAAFQDIGPVMRELTKRELLSEMRDVIGVLRGTAK